MQITASAVSLNVADVPASVAFLTSHAGQTTIARGESFEYPLAAGVSPNPAITPLSELSLSGFTAAEFGTGAEAKKLLQEAQLL